jgi:hypothetical protein
MIRDLRPGGASKIVEKIFKNLYAFPYGRLADLSSWTGQDCSTGQGDFRLKVILLRCIICMEILAEMNNDEI